ncbi:dimethyladenosine transferase (rRNA methylation) [Thaumarchaeota archaeon SCGC AB-539-E09]|nr:dimethyladenosine transferase (rRNA methylation) [Thaumarchaeota archaeon SCGC AB-539-E09]
MPTRPQYTLKGGIVLLRSETTNMLKKYGIQLDPALDEQQLVALDIIEGLIDSAEVDSDETTLEIGAGCGNITIPLAAQSGKVIAVEKNPKFTPLLKGRTSKLANVNIIQDDILTSKIPYFTRLVSNLPYSLCEAIFTRLIHHDFKKASLIVSSSFADIITAKPEDPKYSRLSMVSSLFFTVKKMQEIPPDSYYPEPGVKTSMITVEPIPAKGAPHEILRLIILWDRMKLKNALREALITSSKDRGPPVTKREAKNIINSMNLDPRILDTRVARLSLHDLLTVEKALNDHI